MNKISVKTVMVQPTYLMCVTTQGGVITITDPEKMNWVMENALPVFTKSKNAVLELDLDNVVDTTITTGDGSIITFNKSSITTEKAKYSLDLRSLESFSVYAQANGYSVAPLIEKVSQSLDINDVESMKDLFTFLTKNNLPITVEGNILAYKVLYESATGLLYDCYSKTIYQDIGDEVYMPRSFVTVDRSMHCSTGLHVCSIQYAQWFMRGSCTLALVKVDPRDICSVPTDTASKVRCCRYQILGLISDDELPAVFDDNLDAAPKYKELLNHAINEDFEGTYRVHELLTPTVVKSTDVSTRTIGKFKLKLSVDPDAQRFNNLVKKVMDKDTKSFPSFYANLNYLMKSSNSALSEDKDFLQQLKHYRKTFSWKELGVDNVWRKRLERRLKKYGI